MQPWSLNTSTEMRFAEKSSEAVALPSRDSELERNRRRLCSCSAVRSPIGCSRTRRGPGPHRRKLVAGAALWFHFLGKGLLFSSFWGDRRRGITLQCLVSCSAAQFQKDWCSMHVMADRLVQVTNCSGRQHHDQ